MAIRIRKVKGTYVALCAVESDPEEGDIYLDDSIHYALAAKFMEDWKGETQTGGDGELVALMETQKVRDAEEEAKKWSAAAAAYRIEHPGIAEFGWTEIKPHWESLFGLHYSTIL